MLSLARLPLAGRRTHAIAVVAAAFFALPCVNAAAGTISGTVFMDLNRDGVLGSGETPMSGKGVLLLDATGQTQLAFKGSDATGRYSFTNLAPGSYRVELDPSDWWQLRQDWAPTTTGSVFPRVDVNLTDSASADFGWRPIVRSTEALGPISTYTGANGLRVDSYDDVVPASEVYDRLTAGTLVGAEAQSVTIHFDDGPYAVCTTSVNGSDGSYSNYHADVRVPYLSWLDHGDDTLFHEYGHAWSLYYAYMVQQNTSLDSYLALRGVLGDARLDTTHAWGRRELIAEDYRQLFGTASARAGAQENSDLPAAPDVPGLRDFLTTTFMQPVVAPPPPPPSDPPPPPPPAPAPVLGITGLAMSPAPVKTTGTAGFTLSISATVTVAIRDSKGNLVRTLLGNAAEPAGSASAGWDRKNAAGQRVKSGTYTVKVDAIDSGGTRASASASFRVS